MRSVAEPNPIFMIFLKFGPSKSKFDLFKVTLYGSFMITTYRFLDPNYSGYLHTDKTIGQVFQQIVFFVNPLQLFVAYLYPMKTSRFLYVFRGYRKRTPGCNKLKFTKRYSVRHEH